MQEENYLSIINEQAVEVGVAACDKETVFEHVARRLEQIGVLTSSEHFKKDLYERESQGPTGIGGGIAIPHGKSLAVKNTCISIVKLDEEDRLTGNCYINTLEAYLTSEKNVGKIAEKLFIHRNTLMYRLDKIVTLTGLDYDNLAEMEYVLLSIYVLRLVKKGHSGMPSFLPATRQWESFEERKD